VTARVTRWVRKPIVGIAVSVVVLNVGVVAGLHALFPNLSFFPQEETVAAAPAPAPAKTVAQRSGPLPAETVLGQVFASDPALLPGDGWRAASDQGGALGTPFDYPCGTPEGAAPVAVESRGWAQTTGPLPSDLRAAVTVSMRAYGAGGGAAAFAALEDSITGCSGASQSARSGLGVEAMAARNAVTAALVWREGDVLGVVTYQAAGNPGDLAAVTALAGEFDGRLTAALSGVCVAVDSTLADAGRSPYINRAAFTGRTVPYTVTLDQSFADAATARQAATTAQSGVVAPAVAVPAPVITLPTIGTLPTRPTGEGVTPDALPTKVDKPTAPTAPVAAATTKDIPRVVADPDGPGCGWAFTGQVAPAFDATAADTALKAAEKSTQSQLQTAWVTWLQQRDAYYVAYAAFQQQADAYIAYAQQVSDARVAWAKIDAARKTYDQQMKTYNDAVAARDKFLADQQTAQTAFDAAVASCQTSTASPSETASPTGSPTSTPRRPTTPPSATPTGAPSTSAAPTTSAEPTPTQVCPPVRPLILDQQAPSVPTKPTAPAAPGVAPQGN
jgi:hypothetical protein